MSNSNDTRPEWTWVKIGGAMALVGLAIILWPERGAMPHPLTFPPSESARPIAGYAVFGYPLLGAGSLFVLAGLLRHGIRAVVDR